MEIKHEDQIVTFCILFCCLVSSVQPVRIKELRVPSVARHGASVILDCDYALDEDSNNSSINDKADNIGLVVKWYLNDQSRPVYVWIPGSSGPRGLGVLSGRLNLTYRASDDARTEHRALHIPSSAVDLAGDYTCVVSTFHGEDRKTKNMLVFVPEKNLRLRQSYTPDGRPGVVCAADGVYPEPDMVIRMTYDNVTREMEGTPVLRREGDNGLFDISVLAALPEDVLNTPALENAAFTCELRIPRANNYTVKKEFVYYSGSSHVSKPSTYATLLLVLFSTLLCS